MRQGTAQIFYYTVYAKALNRINREEYQKVKNELIAKITDEELRSVFGWQVIQQMAGSETDRSVNTYYPNKTFLRKCLVSRMYKLC
jgi:hypothetical protein